MVKGILPSKDKAEPFLFMLVLDEPPQQLWNEHLKRRIEYYKKFEGTEPLRDKMPTYTESRHYAQRLRADGEASKAIWEALIGRKSEEDLDKVAGIIQKLKCDLK